MPARGWGGRRAQAYRAAVFAEYGTSCWLAYPDLCTRVATTVDHVVPRSRAPWLQWVVGNGRPACLACNSRRKDGPAPAQLRVVDTTAWFR